VTQFFVPGTPTAQGSKSAVVRNGRAFVIEGKGEAGRQAFKAWRAQVTATAHEHFPAPFVGPVRVYVDFYFPKPKSAPKAMMWAAKRPDADKALRAVLDALTGVAFVDDGQVVDLRGLKFYAVGSDGRTPITTGAEIRVEIAADPRGDMEVA